MEWDTRAPSKKVFIDFEYTGKFRKDGGGKSLYLGAKIGKLIPEGSNARIRYIEDEVGIRMEIDILPPAENRKLFSPPPMPLKDRTYIKKICKFLRPGKWLDCEDVFQLFRGKYSKARALTQWEPALEYLVMHGFVGVRKNPKQQMIKFNDPVE